MGRSSQVAILVGVVFVLIIGAAVYGIWSKHTQNEDLRDEIERYDTERRGLEARVASRPQKERLFNDIKTNFREIVSILPLSKADNRDQIFKDLTAYGSRANLKFRRLVTDVSAEEDESARIGEGRRPTAGGARPAPQPKKPEFGDFEQTELTVRYRGTFFDFLEFLSLIEQREKFLRVDKVVLQPTPGDEEIKILDIEIKLSTFHYKT